LMVMLLLLSPFSYLLSVHLSHDCSLFAFGANDEGTLGLGSTSDGDDDDGDQPEYVYTPTPIGFFNAAMVVAFSCGDRHVLAVTRSACLSVCIYVLCTMYVCVFVCLFVNLYVCMCVCLHCVCIVYA
jgi:hypothetical protein